MRRDGGVPSLVQEPPNLVQISRRCLGFGEDEAGMFFDHPVALLDFRLRPSQELCQGSVGGAPETSPSRQLSSADRALRVSEAAGVYCYEQGAERLLPPSPGVASRGGLVARGASPWAPPSGTSLASLWPREGPARVSAVASPRRAA